MSKLLIAASVATVLAAGAAPAQQVDATTITVSTQAATGHGFAVPFQMIVLFFAAIMQTATPMKL